MNRRILAGCLVAAMLVTAGACSGDDDASPESAPEAPPLDEVLDALATGVIVPTYTELVATLDALGTSIDTLCATPSAAGLDTARTAWRAAADAWQRSRPMGVGPAMERRLMSTIGYPIRPDDIAEILAGSEPVTPDTLADSGASARGLAAVELLLFEPAVADQALATGAPGSRRCVYAAAAVELAATATRGVLDDWTGDSGAEPFTATFVDGSDGDPQSSLAELVNETSHALQTIDDQGLRGIAAAETPEDVAAPQRDGAAGHRVADLRAQLDGVRAVIEGAAGDDGIRAAVADRSADTAARLDEALAAAVASVGALPDSIPETLALPDELAAASEDAAALKVLLSTEVASVLGVTIGFSDADGDS